MAIECPDERGHLAAAFDAPEARLGVLQSGGDPAHQHGPVAPAPDIAHEVADELLKKLLQDELKVRSERYLVQSRRFSDMLERALNAYKNRAIETAQVLEELVALAKQMREAHAKGERLGLTEDELAFYDALGVNDAAVKVMGDVVLRAIAKELTDTIRRTSPSTGRSGRARAPGSARW